MSVNKGGLIIIEIGKINHLRIANFSSSGAYLDAGTGNKKDNVLLPGKEIPLGAQEGDPVQAFIYKDSENRLISTLKKPLAVVGDLAYLRVTAKTKIGAFLDFGIERGLFLPFSEQRYPIQVGRSYLVHLYLDKSRRICCTTDIYSLLKSDSPYQKNDRIQGTVYSVNPAIGTFVAVDDKYLGLIPMAEFFGILQPGDRIEARVIRVREDGKLDLSPREASHQQMNKDADIILHAMQSNRGILPLDDHADPDEIKKQYKMSKAAFKRAIGGLLKTRKIVKTEKGYRINPD